MERKNPFTDIYKQCNSGDPMQKLKNLKEFPTYIDIELTNNCNYKCLMCPIGTGVAKRKKGFMSKELYNKILEEIKAYKTPLRFIRWGEPTLHKDFIEFIEKAKACGIICHVNTNGTILDKESFERLLDLKLDSIKFSFQGIDEKSYREMRNENYFDQLIEKIELLHRLRGERMSPFIHVATTVTYEDKESIDIFKNKAEKIADMVSVGRTQLEHIDIEKAKLSEEEKNRIKQLKSKETLVKKRLNCCPEVFDKLSIDWDGKVTACCGDYDNEMVIGDLKDNTLKEIWNGERMNEYRDSLSRREYEKHKLCKDCYDYMSIQADNVQDV